jgi:hemoglobin-like flavoprotein/class 3 adenylate cyclase/predicted Ser/Thr protein kinase
MSENTQVGKYRLLDRIGSGAMGEVFRAHDEVLDRFVALKVISAPDDERRQRFRREAQSVARLSHPNIVTVHDFGEDSGRFFMAMELLEGNDLKRLIATGAFPELRSKLQVMEQVCDAVAFAHATNIVHRDLKPANIFVLPNVQVKILDFGLALLGQSDMTGTGTILGTPNYMAPEQIRGLRVDGRADIFSLGAVFYELLSGRKAFDAPSLHTVLYKVMQHEPESLRLLSPSIPTAVYDIVIRALQKDPAKRFRSVAEMRGAIRSLRDRTTIPSTLTLADVLGELQSETLVGRRDISLVSGTVVLRDTETSRSAPAQPMPVTFTGEPAGEVIVDVAPQQTLLAASLAAGIAHTHACGGNARCSTCRVLVLSGSENLSPRDSAELNLAKRFGFGDEIRLACQTKTRGPVRLRRLIIDADDVRMIRPGEEASATGNETPLAILSARAREFQTLLRRGLPYDVVHILNRWYLQMGEAILANGGQLEPPAGGGLTAYFGIKGEDATTKCTSAIRAALRMQSRMAPLNAYLNEHFAVTLKLDIGLHYGRMIVGRMGHPDQMRVTAIGEASEIALAVCAANETHGDGIIATEEVVNIVEGAIRFGQISHEVLGGRDREFTLYDVVDFAKPDTHFLVQSSFEKIAPRREEASRLFYKHLFEIAPHVQAMFAHVDLEVQGAMLMNMIAAAVKGLDRLDELKPVLEDLGRRHAAYGVRIEHYAAVEECLLHMLATLMGGEFNVDVRLAWTRIYNFIAETMIEAAMSNAQ